MWFDERQVESSFSWPSASHSEIRGTAVRCPALQRLDLTAGQVGSLATPGEAQLHRPSDMRLGSAL